MKMELEKDPVKIQDFELKESDCETYLGVEISDKGAKDSITKSMRKRIRAAMAKEVQLSKLLSQYKGKVVLLDFWASWCSPCRRSFPWFIAMQNKYQQQGLEVIAVNIDVERSDADAFLAEFAVNFTIIYDPDAVIVGGLIVFLQRIVLVLSKIQGCADGHRRL